MNQTVTPVEPVLIVGAGPVGLSAALMLARHGIRLRIIDANEGPTDLSKALVIWKRTMDTLNPVLPFERFSDGHPHLRQALIGFGNHHSAVVNFPTPSVGAPSSAMIPQSGTERVLLHRLSELGVEVERRTELLHYSADDLGVTSTIRSTTGSEDVRSQWLLGCDGAHSVVRHGLAIDFPGTTLDRRWMLADFEIAGSNPPPADQVIIKLAQGVNAAFPMGGARWRLIADQGAGHGSEGEMRTPSRDEIQRTLNERTDLGWQVGEIHWTSEFGVNERQVAEYTHGRVVLVGDAAHLHSPAGGQGMNTGIGDASNLAWKLALVLRGAASERLIATYNSERRPVGEEVVRKSSLLLEAAMVEGPLKAIRDRVLPAALSLSAVQNMFSTFLMEETVDYRKGPLADRSGRGPTRSGDFWGLDVGSQAALVLVGDIDESQAPKTLGGPDGIPLTTSAMVPDDPRAMLLPNRAALLIRPDGIVASIGDDIDEAMEWERLLVTA
jgi:2-polyprenyl-6-methoxyphenol hydroxylase-like FAD-dependent oxidoreductase